MDAKSIGRKIYELRKQKGFTQRELADKVNVTNKAVSKWENGINFPDPAIMDSLAEALGVKVTDLIEPKEEPIKVNKTILYSALVAGLAPVACAFITSALEIFGDTGYVILGLEVIAFVLITFNFMINERFLWNHYDGKTYLQITQFCLSMGLIMNAMYTFVPGASFVGLTLYIVLYAIECTQEMNYSRNSSGLIKRTMVFVLGTLLLAFVICWRPPVPW